MNPYVIADVLEQHKEAWRFGPRKLRSGLRSKLRRAGSYKPGRRVMRVSRPRQPRRR